MHIVCEIMKMLIDKFLSIFKSPPKKIDPLWLKLAKGETWVAEILGSEHNGRIIEYHQMTELKATDDETNWCASFVCWCLEKAGIQSPRTAWSRSFLNWGVPLDYPKYGCIVILKRGSGGHIGFLIEETELTLRILGGNQDDKVCIKEYAKERLLGYRWPVLDEKPVSENN